jgi:hypothetical protein
MTAKDRLSGGPVNGFKIECDLADDLRANAQSGAFVLRQMAV